MEKNEKWDLSSKYNLRQYPNGFKVMVIDRLVKSSKSANQTAIELGIPNTSLSAYKKQLLDQLGFFRILNEMKDKKQSDEGSSNLEQENAELKKALELAMLKVAGLETMIDIAEDQLNIDIRKKSGAKQSK